MQRVVSSFCRRDNARCAALKEDPCSAEPVDQKRTGGSWHANDLPRVAPAITLL
jgi:hypothetical protein